MHGEPGAERKRVAEREDGGRVGGAVEHRVSTGPAVLDIADLALLHRNGGPVDPRGDRCAGGTLEAALATLAVALP